MVDKNNFVIIEKKVLFGMLQEGISGLVEVYLDFDIIKKVKYNVLIG